MNYFAGWWQTEPNKWHGRDGKDWRPQYPDRLPLLGEYNDQETTDREITAAANYGVDFFSFLWYGADPDPKQLSDWEGRTQAQLLSLLDRGVENFVRSPQAHRLRFMIEFTNHPPFGVTTDEEWQRSIEIWVRLMRHPSYLRVGGRCVFKVHGGSQFLRQNGGDPARCKARLELLRRAARQAGLGEMIIGAGVAPGDAMGASDWVAKVFDFTACYMGVPPLEQRAEDYSWDMLARWTAENRLKHAHDAIPYLPYVAAGWNPRPWSDPRATFALPDRRQWREELQQVKEDLNRGRFGLPLPDGRVQPAFTTYCWNEFGEGGFVAPTKGDGYMKLEEIRNLFGVPTR
jgi:hypothetical protein